MGSGIGLRAGDVVVVSRPRGSSQFGPRGVVVCGDVARSECDAVRPSPLLPGRNGAVSSAVPFGVGDGAAVLVVGAVSGAGGSSGAAAAGAPNSQDSLAPGAPPWLGPAFSAASAEPRCATSEGLPGLGACRNATTAPTTATGTSAPACHGHAAGFASTGAATSAALPPASRRAGGSARFGLTLAASIARRSMSRREAAFRSPCTSLRSGSPSSVCPTSSDFAFTLAKGIVCGSTRAGIVASTRTDAALSPWLSAKARPRDEASRPLDSGDSDMAQRDSCRAKLAFRPNNWRLARGPSPHPWSGVFELGNRECRLAGLVSELREWQTCAVERSKKRP